MIYSSVVFLFYFLPLVLLIYYLVPGLWAKNAVLFVASLIFYAWGAGTLVVLLLSVGLCAWLFSWLITKTKQKKAVLILAVIIYLGVLFYYKYLGFILEAWMGKGFAGTWFSGIVIPAGVSFFIFQAISYNIDVYRKSSTFERNPFFVIAYLCMFPQLMSGPLVRYGSIGPQLRARTFDFSRFIQGVKRFIVGLAKKVLIANPLGLLVHQIISSDPAFLGPSVAWIGIIAFTLQLYFDFSGYTDMAIGVGKMLGFDLPENFNFPYISRSISEFWRRWHMTLSGWLRDYVFMPLSLSFRRLRNTGVFLALLVTFTLCGIWHNPGWNFLIWGAIHGLFLGLEHLFLKRPLERIKGFSILYTLFIVVTSFVFVCTGTFDQAIRYLGLMFTPAASTALGPAAFVGPHHLFLLVAGAFLCLPLRWPEFFKTRRLKPFTEGISLFLFITVFLLSAMALTSETYNPFLYFKF